MNCLTQAWTQHAPELRGWARHRLGNATDAEDQLQDIFLKALRQGERFCAVQNSRLQRARPRMKQHMTIACQVQFNGVGNITDFVPRS
jgi:RNA polymerase sigma-70 factor (ECF subfamily)